MRKILNYCFLIGFKKIKSIIAEYGEENCYISFSGGKDSTVLHYLVDLALPNNKINGVLSVYEREWCCKLVYWNEKRRRRKS